MKTGLPFLLAFLLLSVGCSQRDWMAKFYMVKAENNLNKASQLKSKKRPYEARLKYYRKACKYFDQAYEYDRGLFTNMRIEEAVDACWKSGLKDLEEKFKVFGEKYAKAHPQEFEHGEQGVSLDLGG